MSCGFRRLPASQSLKVVATSNREEKKSTPNTERPRAAACSKAYEPDCVITETFHFPAANRSSQMPKTAGVPPPGSSSATTCTTRGHDLSADLMRQPLLSA